MPPRDELVDHMLDEINTLASGLSDWESQFVEDIFDQWTRIRSLSNKQFEILNRIYEEKVK